MQTTYDLNISQTYLLLSYNNLLFTLIIGLAVNPFYCANFSACDHKWTALLTWLFRQSFPLYDSIKDIKIICPRLLKFLTLEHLFLWSHFTYIMYSLSNK